MAAKRRVKKRQSLTIEVPKRGRGRPKMTDEQKAEAKAKREALQDPQQNAGNLSGTAKPVKRHRRPPAQVAAAPVRRRRQAVPGMTKDKTIEMLNQRNTALEQELTTLRGMLGKAYAQTIQGSADVIAY